MSLCSHTPHSWYVVTILTFAPPLTFALARQGGNYHVTVYAKFVNSSGKAEMAPFFKVWGEISDEENYRIAPACDERILVDMIQSVCPNGSLCFFLTRYPFWYCAAYGPHSSHYTAEISHRRPGFGSCYMVPRIL